MRWQKEPGPVQANLLPVRFGAVINGRALLRIVLPLLFLVPLFSAPSHSAAASTAATTVRSFEGQVLRCAQKSDLGRMAYEVRSLRATVRPPNLMMEIDGTLQTLKCRQHGHRFRFEPANLTGRVTNASGGFIEFNDLEFVGYTPDLRVFRAQKLDLRASLHRVKLSVPASGFAGLLPRNLSDDGDRQIALMTMLRGRVSLGDAPTGKVLARTVETLGAYAFRLKESTGHLLIRRTPLLTSANRP